MKTMNVTTQPDGNAALDRFRLYRCGWAAYAYNPNTRLWEVYELNKDGEIVGISECEQSKRSAGIAAAYLNRRARARLDKARAALAAAQE